MIFKNLKEADFLSEIIFVLFCFRAMKLNKGSILKASVEYVKELKKDKEKLVSFEVKQKTMEAKYQKMLIRIFVSMTSKINHISFFRVF